MQLVKKYELKEILRVVLGKKISHAKSVKYDFKRKQQFLQNRIGALEELHEYNEFTRGTPVYVAQELHKMLPMIRKWIRYDAHLGVEQTTGSTLQSSQSKQNKIPQLYTLTKSNQEFVRLNRADYTIPAVFRALFAQGYLMKDMKFNFHRQYTKEELIVESAASMKDELLVDYPRLYEGLVELQLEDPADKIVINWPFINDAMFQIKAIGVYNRPDLVAKYKSVSLLRKTIPLVNIKNKKLLVSRPETQNTFVEGVALLPNRIKEHLDEYLESFQPNDTIDLAEYKPNNLFSDKLEEASNVVIIHKPIKLCKTPPLNVYNRKTSFLNYKASKSNQAIFSKVTEGSEEQFFRMLEDYGTDEFRTVMLDIKRFDTDKFYQELDKEYWNINSLFKIYKTMEKQWFPLQLKNPLDMGILKDMTLCKWDHDILKSLHVLNSLNFLKDDRLNIRTEMHAFIKQLSNYYMISLAEIKSRNLDKKGYFYSRYRQIIFQNVLKFCFFENKWMANMYPNFTFSLNRSLKQEHDSVYHYIKNEIMSTKRKLSKPCSIENNESNLYKSVVENCVNMEYKFFTTHSGQESVDHGDQAIEQHQQFETRALHLKDLKTRYKIVLDFRKKRIVGEELKNSTLIKKFLDDEYFLTVLKNLTFLDVEVLGVGDYPSAEEPGPLLKDMRFSKHKKQPKKSNPSNPSHPSHPSLLEAWDDKITDAYKLYLCRVG
ncbi:hypothetical protein AWRI3579_g3489 [Hanseniaspora osmophila]|uniref:Uncharacterized protein n=1 Tax=Hanseniaspora osmophila TaxID=56408 RepID=A0A1E5R7A0_9ASCO|nr:hypothetical protein AWRI3579_g3489 [Hanseniaspora osmophila]